MPSVVWTPHALQCVHRLHTFLSCKNAKAAESAATALFRHAEILEQFPNAGRKALDLDPDQRELLVPFGTAGYVILYHLDSATGTVTILAIRHQREVGYST